MMISEEGLCELGERLADHSMGMQAIRVLLEMVSLMDKQNRCRAGRKDLARRLGMREGNVSAAIKTLQELGFVERPEFRFDPYVISPRFAWSGPLPKLREALRERGQLDSDGMMTGRAA